MTTPTNPLREALRRAAAAINEAMAAAGGEPDTPTDPVDPELAVPAAPEWLNVTLDAGKAVCSWARVYGATRYEVHELLADPANTLKATVTGTTRTSGKLKGGTYRYAVRAVNHAGPGPFSGPVDVVVGAKPGPGEATDPVDPVEPGEPTDPVEPGLPLGSLPHDVLPEIRNWTLMLPTGTQGDPDNVYPQDVGEVSGVFYVQDDGGVAFVADVVNGVHSPNSKYPRCELRQMINDDWAKAAWSSSGSHSLTATLSLDISKLVARPRVNGLQIHNGGDDVGQLMYDKSLGLGWMHKDGQEFLSIDKDYRSGTKIRVTILAEKDRVKVWCNDQLKVDIPEKGSGWYWKCGAYAQTGGASTYKEPAGAVAKVVIYELSTTGGAQ